MAKRVNVQRSEKVKIELLKQWKAHPEWDSFDAARELGVKESTLRGWKKLYWDDLDQLVGSNRKRRKGKEPGPDRKMKPYEGRVLEYFDNLRVEGKCSFSDMMYYCQSIEEFLKEYQNIRSQKSWVTRFIQHYSPKDGVGKKDDGGGVICGRDCGEQIGKNGVKNGGRGDNCGSGGANEVDDCGAERETASQGLRRDGKHASAVSDVDEHELECSEPTSHVDTAPEHSEHDVTKDRAKEGERVGENATEHSSDGSHGAQHEVIEYEATEHEMTEFEAAEHEGLEVESSTENDVTIQNYDGGKAAEQWNLRYLSSWMSKMPTYGAATFLQHFKLFKFSKRPKILAIMVKRFLHIW